MELYYNEEVFKSGSVVQFNNLDGKYPAYIPAGSRLVMKVWIEMPDGSIFKSRYPDVTDKTDFEYWYKEYRRGIWERCEAKAVYLPKEYA